MSDIGKAEKLRLAEARVSGTAIPAEWAEQIMEMISACYMGFFAYPPEKVYSSDQTARSGWTGIWSNSWMSAGKSMVSGALRNS
jgi:hypothetical protein